ncbi:MAG: hypothetical protein GY857_01510 [Desulfobacula sp.]|nr:hypothetical protein [Desulfobacula sp.]
MKYAVKIVFFVLIASTSLLAYADTEFAGNFKTTYMGMAPHLKGASKHIAQEFILNTVKLKTSTGFGEKLSFDFAYDLSVNYTHINDLNNTDSTDSRSFKYRAYDLDSDLKTNEISQTNILNAKQNIDRAFFTYSTESFDFFAGRQAVSFGSGRFINPTDVLVPYPLTQIDKEEREGVDALRLKLPISEMGEFDAGVIFGEKGKNKNNAYYLNAKYPVLNWDTSVMIMQFRENMLLGLDLQGEISGAGIWLESAHVIAKNSDDYFRLSIGLDFNFPWDLYTFAEYHYNGAGVVKSEDYHSNSSTQPYIDGGVYLLGQHYLTLGLTYEISPLIGFSQSVIVNLDDSSFLFSPKVEYNILENQYIDFGVFLGVGEKSRSQSALKSEFGAYQDSAYIGYRVYF